MSKFLFIACHVLLLSQISLSCLEITSIDQASNYYDNGALVEYPGYIEGESNIYTGYQSCIYEYSELLYEIRIVGCYESNSAHSGFRVHNPGPLYVNLQTCGGEIDSDIPLVLVLNSYENTWWIIDSDDDDVINNINFHEILVYAYHTENTTVELGPNLQRASIKVTNGMHVSYGYYGYKQDHRICDLITNLYEMYEGECSYSFIGAYEYETVHLCVGSQDLPTKCPSTACADPSEEDGSDGPSEESKKNKSGDAALGLAFLVGMFCVLPCIAFVIYNRWHKYNANGAVKKDSGVIVKNDSGVIEGEMNAFGNVGEGHHMGGDEGVCQDATSN